VSRKALRQLKIQVSDELECELDNIINLNNRVYSLSVEYDTIKASLVARRPTPALMRQLWYSHANMQEAILHVTELSNDALLRLKSVERKVNNTEAKVLRALAEGKLPPATQTQISTTTTTAAAAAAAATATVSKRRPSLVLQRGGQNLLISNPFIEPDYS
jgi:hypothetical protein